MDIEYRPADNAGKLEPIAEAFFRLYELKGPSGVRVEPSINELTPGIMICPQEGSVIEEICAREVPATGKLVRSGRNYATVDITPGQRCLVNFEYYESIFRD